MNIKVGVRIRPFSKREIYMNSTLCIDMNGNTTSLYDVKGNQKPLDFNFDYCFWSHNQFSALENGYLASNDQKYADQQCVFNQIGKQIIHNAFQGYHCCLLSYGDSGTGKTYSMFGTNSNKGLIPNICQQLFSKINNKSHLNKQYQVMISMLEIQRQKINDLLADPSLKIKQELKIRQDKNLGVYIQGITKHKIDKYQQCEKIIELGLKNKKQGTNFMNANFSRAQIIVSIQFKEITLQDNIKIEKLSNILLSDLAGRERIMKAGCIGDLIQLHQITSLGKTSLALGQVISALADRSLGKNISYIPYRGSCLTKILQNALGGNSKTFMICAISPASDNYDETLSTLRFANKAMQIKNKPIINLKTTNQLIKTLLYDNQNVKQKLINGQKFFIQPLQPFQMFHDKNKIQMQNQVYNLKIQSQDKNIKEKQKQNESIVNLFFNQTNQQIDQYFEKIK